METTEATQGAPTSRVRGRLERWHRALELGLRRVLNRSMTPPCCSVEKVAFVRTLLGPDGDEPRRPASAGMVPLPHGLPERSRTV